MPRKKKNNSTLLLLLGAGGLAYLIMREKSAPAGSENANALNDLRTDPLKAISTGITAIKNIIAPSSPVEAPISLPKLSPVTSSPVPISVAKDYDVLPVKSTVQNPLAYKEYLTPLPSTYTAYSHISGFEEITGTGLAIMCGCALCSPSKSIGKFDWTSLILPAALIGGGYLLITKVGNLFTGDNSSNNTDIAKANQQATQTAIDNAKAHGIPQTKSDSQLSSAADYIYTVGSKHNGTGSSADQKSITDTVIGNVDTVTDYLRMKQLFGTKKVSTDFFSTCYILGFNCNAVDLDTFLKLALDESHIDGLKNYFVSQGIAYGF